MGKRREAREAALQFLFSHDLNTRLGEEEAEAFWQLRRASPSVRAFAEELIQGVRTHAVEIDARLAAALENFTLDRLSTVDRNLLRMAAFELLHLREIPAAVTINEAIEIARRFGENESARFVNGVLDRIRRDERPAT
jgi:transcription antitermination protein NusB